MTFLPSKQQIIIMESTGPSGKASETPGHRWASLMGTAIAILTLTIPLTIIATYSSYNSVEPIPPTYSVAKPRN